MSNASLEEVTDRLQGTKLSDMTRGELLEFLGAIAQRGADNALRGVGLGDEDALLDIRNLRDLLRGYRVVRKGALQQLGKVIVWIFVLSVMGMLYNSKTTTEIVKAVQPLIGGG